MLLLILLIVFVGVAAGLAWFLLAHDKGEKEPIAALWLAVAFGFLGAFVATLIESRLINPDNLLPGMPHSTVLFTAMAVGAIEEICKFLPLAVVIYHRRYFNEHTDGIIYFALAGLGFGLPENIIYTLQFGGGTGATRLLLTPLFHAATTGIIGYYLAKQKLSGKAVIGVGMPLTSIIILHGLYDFGLASGSSLYAAIALLITLGTTGTLFLLFLRATEHDQEMGLSVVGNNSFCRSCGWANPTHHLYCTQCGKNA